MPVYINSGWPFKYVTISKDRDNELAYVEPSDDYAMICEKVKLRQQITDEQKSYLLKHIPIFFGGPMSEGKFVQCEEWWLYNSTGSDLTDALGYMEYLYGTHNRNIKGIVDGFKDDVRRLFEIEKVWGHIKLIAKLLMEKQKLFENECRELFSNT